MNKTLPTILVSLLVLTACGAPPPEDNGTGNGTEEPGQNNGQQEPSNANVRLETVRNGTMVICPFELKGEARGTWFFEANLPVRLVDSNGDIFFQKGIMTAADWMTENFVPFEDTLYFQTSSETGQLVVAKDNPSGLPENDDEVSYDVSFVSCTDAQMQEYQQGKVEEYIRSAISSLSPEPPVLGGTWYVTKVNFMPNHMVEVTYEDGHIERSFRAQYTIDTSDAIALQLIP